VKETIAEAAPPALPVRLRDGAEVDHSRHRC